MLTFCVSRFGLFSFYFVQVRRSTEARTGVYQEVMETAKGALSAALRKDKEFTSQLAGGVTLEHRIKEPYSMWKKMERQGGGVDSVYDAVALRVVLKAKRDAGESDEAHEEKSRKLCYHVRSESLTLACARLCQAIKYIRSSSLPHITGCSMVYLITG